MNSLLGSIFGYYPFLYSPLDLYQNSIPVCIHPNCPICAEKHERLIKEWLKQEELKEKKREDYEKRCKEYMKKFRSKK